MAESSRIVPTSTAVTPPAAGGWVPSQLARVALSTGVACLAGVGQYLSVSDGHPLTVAGAFSACFVAAGGFLASLFGIGSAGPRKQ